MFKLIQHDFLTHPSTGKFYEAMLWEAMPTGERKTLFRYGKSEFIQGGQGACIFTNPTEYDSKVALKKRGGYQVSNQTTAGRHLPKTIPNVNEVIGKVASIKFLFGNSGGEGKSHFFGWLDKVAAEYPNYKVGDTVASPAPSAPKPAPPVKNRALVIDGWGAW